MKDVKVYVEHEQQCMENIFWPLGWTCVKSPEEANVIQLIGGADIDSSWYNGIPHPQTRGSLHRDDLTARLYQSALERNIPVLGVCRGAQFINAVVGGDMYQHVDGHFDDHLIIDVTTNKEYLVNSIHHQMMIPHESAVCVAKAFPQVATFRETVDSEGIVQNPITEAAPEWEVLFYPHIKALCYQAHPEYASKNEDTRQYYYELLRRYYPELF